MQTAHCAEGANYLQCLFHLWEPDLWTEDLYTGLKVKHTTNVGAISQKNEGIIVSLVQN
jgi:hypothetical protein